MENNTTDDFKARLDSIASQLQQLGKDYPMSEYNLIVTKFNEEGKYETGIHAYNVKDCNNLSRYAEQMYALRNTMIERNRFKYLLHLPEFRVRCNNDLMDGNVQDAIKREGGGDWVRRDEEYVVWMKKKSPTGGWTFFIKDKDNNVLKPPFPYQGYHCSRFSPADYTKDN